MVINFVDEELTTGLICFKLPLATRNTRNGPTVLTTSIFYLTMETMNDEPKTAKYTLLGDQKHRNGPSVSVRAAESRSRLESTPGDF